MKKRNILIMTLLLGMLFSFSQAQTVIFSSGFETWNGNSPDGWMGSKSTISPDSVSPYTTSVHGGTSACRLVNSLSGHKRFTTQPVSVTNSLDYTITFWVRGQGNIRTGLYDQRTSGSGYAPYNAYVNVNAMTWTEVTQTITCANSTAAAEFILSVQYTVGASDHLQVDDVTITEPGSGVPAIFITSPVNNSTVYSASVNVSFNVASFVVGNPGTGIDGHIHYTLDGGAAQMHYATTPIALTGLSAGAHQVILQLVDNNHNPLNPPVADTTDFTVDLNPPNLHTIHEIQYTTDLSGDSPYAGQVVSTRGVVTGTHASGYFIQHGSGAWNGVYVYDNQNHPLTGDSVLVTATVQEYFNLTELSQVTAFTLISSGNPLPAPVQVDCGGVNSEQYEGVLVTAYHVTCTNPSAGFGMWKIEDQNGDTAKVHNLLFAYTPTLNQVYDITGPVYYSFSEYRVLPRNAGDVVIITGIGDPDPERTRISLFPNPAAGELRLSGMTGIHRVAVTSLKGQLVLEADVNADELSLPVSSLSPGVYHISLFREDHGVITKSFVKN